MHDCAQRNMVAMSVLALAVMFASMSLRAEAMPGMIRLEVDARQAPQKILHAHMQIPVQAGPLTLYYPKWLPGEHIPDGPIIEVAEMKFSAGGKTIPWRRDLVEMFSIHLDIPHGGTASGFDNLGTSFKYQVAKAPSAEFALSVSLDVDWRGTGAKEVDAESFTTLTPTIFAGQGFGFLPESMKLLPPFAITAQVG